MRYDSFEKRTRIPFKVAGGKLVHFYDGKPIIELREGTIGDLVVNDYSVGDKARIEQYNAEREALFLPEGTRLLARISNHSVPKSLREWLVVGEKFIGASAVEIYLTKDLKLRLRGTKEAQLLPCPCDVPALAPITEQEGLPASVNQAYTLITKHFEPHRSSTGGSVFNCVFYCQEPLKIWQPLKHLRDQFQADHETTVVATKPASESSGDSGIVTTKHAGLAEAIALASEAHVNQTDKAGAPYILHPLRMMQRLDGETERTVAVLHDIVEDTPWTLDDLRAMGFSREVVEAVDCLTRRAEETYDEFIERAKGHPIARRVKLIDIEDNLNIMRLSELTDKDIERLRKYHRIRQLLIDDTAA